MKWIVILSRTNAKIYRDLGQMKVPVLVKEMASTIPRERNRAFHRDKPGMDATWGGERASQYHVMTREKDPHELAAVEFMKKVMIWINKTAIENKVTEVVLVCDSHIYGIVRPLMNEKLKVTLKHVRKNLGKTKIIPSQMQEIIGI